MRNPAAPAFALLGGRPRPRRRASADQLSGGRPHDALPRQAPPHCASGMNAAPPRPKRESARFPQPWTPEGIGTGCETVLRCACTAANVGGQSNRQHRPRCKSIDPAVRNAAGCRPWHRVRCLAQGSGKSLHRPKCSACSRRKTRVRPVHPHAAHRAAEADATRIEHAWSDRKRVGQRACMRAWTSRAPRRVRIPHFGRSTSVGQRCTHANDIGKRRAATSEACGGL